MKTHYLAATVSALSILGGCGGNDAGESDGPPPGATLYAEVTPTLGSLDTFLTSTVDDSDNTVNRGYEERVTSVGADGSYQLNQDDPSNQSTTINGITYHYEPTIRQYGATASGNLETSYIVTQPNGVLANCSLALLSGSHPKPWYVGQAWSLRYTVTCGSNSTTYSESGTVVAAESITVPAGTFATLKNSYALSWSTAAGQNIVERVDAWVDPAHAFFTVKRTDTYQRTGAVPAHYVLSDTVELQSRH